MEALTAADQPLPSVKVHPLVITSILNSYMRRIEKEGRIVGMLLGVVRDGVVEITDCFGFPHHESLIDGKNSVYLDVVFANQRYQFHRRANKNEVVVGWYATTLSNGTFITDFSPLIHEYIQSLCQNPVHIVVDTTLISDTLQVRGFVSEPLVVDGRVLANVFEEIRVDLEFSDGEATILHHMLHSSVVNTGSSVSIMCSVPDEVTTVVKAVDKLTQELDALQAYVDGVVDGSIQGSDEVAEAVTLALDSLTQASASQLAGVEGVVREKNQDLAMVGFLSNLLRTQVHISERLQSVL